MRTGLYVSTIGLVASLAMLAVVVPSAEAGTATTALDGTWYLPGQHDVADKALPTMTLKDGRVSGSDSCNRLIGSYEVRGKRGISFKVGSTMMACPDMAAANAFHAVMRDARKFTIRGSRLILRNANGKALATFKAILK